MGGFFGQKLARVNVDPATSIIQEMLAAENTTNIFQPTI